MRDRNLPRGLTPWLPLPPWPPNMLPWGLAEKVGLTKGLALD